MRRGTLIAVVMFATLSGGAVAQTAGQSFPEGKACRADVVTPGGSFTGWFKKESGQNTFLFEAFRPTDASSGINPPTGNYSWRVTVRLDREKYVGEFPSNYTPRLLRMEFDLTGGGKGESNQEGNPDMKFSTLC